MLILKRLAIWIFEISSQTLLFGFLIDVFGHDPGDFFKDGFISACVVSVVFFSSGYLFSTVAFRAVWANRAWWSYPAIATGLFFIHFEIMNVEVRGAFPSHNRLLIRAVGACIVFACTLAGTDVLRKWAPTRGRSTEPEPVRST